MPSRASLYIRAYRVVARLRKTEKAKRKNYTGDYRQLTLLGLQVLNLIYIYEVVDISRKLTQT
jgi:hypothetical protein